MRSPYPFHGSRGSRGRLASGTKMAASSADDDPLDGGPAAAAVLSGPTIHPQSYLKPAGVPLGIDVIPEARAPAPDGPPQDTLHLTVEHPALRPRNGTRAGQRMNARREQTLIRVNITESRENLLV